MPEEMSEVIDLGEELPAQVALTARDVEGLVEELRAYHAHFAPFFKRREQRDSAEVYLRGLLTTDVPRKNVEAMVLRLFGAGPDADCRVRALQHFVGEGAWDDEAILTAHQRFADETLGEADGVFMIDGSDFAKQGKHSVGVQRQWCGATGKKDNCQAGVFLGYASRRGYTLLDRRLYLPESWFGDDHRELWRACRIPQGTLFQTKHELAANLIEGVMKEGRVRGRWAVCDEGYGDDPALLDRIAACDLWYLAEVPCDTMVWALTEPDGKTPRQAPRSWVRPRKPSHKGPVPSMERVHPDSPPKMRVDELAARIPAANWRRYRILEGAKGPLVADFVAFRAVAVRNKLPGPEVWVLLRRKVIGSEEEPELKYYLSCAPADTPLEHLVRVSGMRWPIESCFEEGKGELGLDEYELRFWPGWHHHMTLVMLAHHFLVQLQRRLSQKEGAVGAAARDSGGKISGAECTAGESGAAAGVGADTGHADQPGRGANAAARPDAAAGLRRPGRSRSTGLSAATQGGCLSLASQAQATPPR